jgi:hypothetical protein
MAGVMLAVVSTGSLRAQISESTRPTSRPTEPEIWCGKPGWIRNDLAMLRKIDGETAAVGILNLGALGWTESFLFRGEFRVSVNGRRSAKVARYEELVAPSSSPGISCVAVEIVVTGLTTTEDPVVHISANGSANETQFVLRQRPTFEDVVRGAPPWVQFDQMLRRPKLRGSEGCDLVLRLETAAGVELRRIPTSEGVAVFDGVVLGGYSSGACVASVGKEDPDLSAARTDALWTPVRRADQVGAVLRCPEDHVVVRVRFLSGSGPAYRPMRKAELTAEHANFAGKDRFGPESFGVRQWIKTDGEGFAVLHIPKSVAKEWRLGGYLRNGIRYFAMDPGENLLSWQPEEVRVPQDGEYDAPPDFELRFQAR